MIFRKYVSSASNLFAENRLAKFIIIALIAVIGSQQYMLRTAFSEHPVFLIPAGGWVKGKVSVSATTLDPLYLNGFGTYIVSLLYSFTPADVQGKYKELTTLLAPDAYASLSAILLKKAENYKDNDVSNTANIVGITLLSKPDVIEIKAEVTKFITSEKIQSKQIKIRIAYAVDNGLPKITKIEEVK